MTSRFPLHGALPALLGLLVAAPARGQTPDTIVRRPVSGAPALSPIQDNSFLVEEAYNQELGVVQHIFTAERAGKSWGASFTQEWPVGGVRHQLSYTLSATRDPAGGSGFGDSQLNYRLQLVGDGEARLAVAPRVSVVLPTGSRRAGRGAGAPGLDVNLPASIALAPWLVTHWNAGITAIPRARNAAGERASLTDVTLGASAIWLLHPRINVMLESVWASEQAVAGDDRAVRATTAIVSPGLRAALNVPRARGLQVIPGIAFPITVHPGGGDRSVFFYLSFEHEFLRGAKGPGC